MSEENLLKIKDFYHLRGATEPASQIVAVGGGKGGVGKSFVSSNLAIFLSNLGMSTIVIDLDLGAANVHTFLGEGTPKIGIGDFIREPHAKLEDFAIPTKFRHLKLVSGHNDSLDIANITDEQRTRLMSAIFNLKADVIVLDLSAGTHSTTLDFFLMAQKHLVTLTPEPSSIENAYRFMKAAFFRRIKRHELQLNLRSTVDEIMNHCNDRGVRSPADLLRAIREQDPDNGARLVERMQKLHFRLVMNQSRGQKDVELGRSIPSVCQKYFGIPASFLGHLDYDNAVWQSLRKMRPMLIEYPHSRLYSQLMAMTRDLMQDLRKKAV